MKTVQELQEDIQKAMEQIKVLQEVCPHLEYKVAMYSYRIGAMAPTRMCKICLQVLPKITEEEYKECWDNWYAYQKGEIECK
jgi:hypothetical protein